MSHFLNVITTRQASQEGALLADLTLGALKSLRASYEKLRDVEDAVWSGRSADPRILRDLDSIAQVDGGYVSAEATQKLHVRLGSLQS